MKNIAKFAFITAGFGLVAALLSTVPYKPAVASGSAPVTVVNTPLPVTGTVNANVSGNVGVNNFPSVQTVNGTIDVAAISGTPFEAALCHAFGPTQGALCGPQGSNFVVPSTTQAGLPVKRLVVENVSGICTGENTPVIAAILFSPFVADSQSNTAPTMAHFFSLTLETTGPGPNNGQTERDYSFGSTTRMFFNPGDAVSEKIEVFTPSDVDAICSVQVEGTLVTQ